MKLLPFLAQFDVNLPDVPADDSAVETALQIFFGIAFMISLLLVTIGALRFVTANGDPQNISKARNTIIYAVIGIVISASAFAIVTFVLGRAL